MKNCIVILIALFLTINVFAEFKLPKKSFTIEQIEAAKEKAKETGKPISFLLSDKNSKCPLCSDASRLIIKSLQRHTIIVYFKDYSDSVPENVKSALQSSKDRYIPKVVVYDSELKEQLGMVTYTEIKNKNKKAFRKLLKKIKESIKKHKKK